MVSPRCKITLRAFSSCAPKLVCGTAGVVPSCQPTGLRDVQRSLDLDVQIPVQYRDRPYADLLAEDDGAGAFVDHDARRAIRVN